MSREGRGEVRVLWRQPLPQGAFGTTAPIAAGGRVYAPYRGVSAWDARTGELLWSRPLAAYGPRNVVVHQGRVFAAETQVFALDARTGRELWRVPVDSAADVAHSAAADGVVYVGTRAREVIALRASDGARVWRTQVGADWTFPGRVAGISVSGDTVYAAGERWHVSNGHRATGWITALDRATGRVLWTFQHGDGSDARNLISPPTVAGRLLLASDRKGNSLVAVDRFTGAQAWRFDGKPGFIGFTMPPQVRGDTVFASSGDQQVYALDLRTGTLRWSAETPASNDFFALCGTVLLANYQGVAVVDRGTGAIRQKLLDSDDEFVSSPFAVEDDRAYVLGNTAMYALECG